MAVHLRFFSLGVVAGTFGCLSSVFGMHMCRIRVRATALLDRGQKDELCVFFQSTEAYLFEMDWATH